MLIGFFIFAVAWVIVLHAVLPWGIKVRETGIDGGYVRNLYLLRKCFISALIACVLTLLALWFFKSQGFN